MHLFLMVLLIMISYHLIMQALAQIALLVEMFGVFCCSSKDYFVYRTGFCWVGGLNRACAAHLMQEYKITNYLYLGVYVCSHSMESNSSTNPSIEL